MKIFCYHLFIENEKLLVHTTDFSEVKQIFFGYRFIIQIAFVQNTVISYTQNDKMLKTTIKLNQTNKFDKRK